MAYITRKFDKYVLYYISRTGHGQQAEIDLFDGRDRAGILYFHLDGTTLPANRNTVNGIYVYFHLSRFSDVMETLREEKPLHVTLQEETGVAYIGSGFEPVGEEETAAP